MRRCSKCGVPKDETDFFRGAGYKDGIRRQCKSCCTRGNTERGKTAKKRKCSRCGHLLVASAFGRTKSVTSWCLKCRRETARLWRAQHPEECAAQERQKRANPQHAERQREYQRLYRLFTKYGITVEEYHVLFERQGGVCAICKEAPSPENTRSGVLHVDHDHVTGKIRGLLCFLCNSLLGSARDCVTRLEAAKGYLTEHSIDPV